MTATRYKFEDTHIWNSSSKYLESTHKISPLCFKILGCRVNSYDSRDIGSTHSFTHFYIPEIFINACDVPGAGQAAGHAEGNKAAMVFALIGEKGEDSPLLFCLQANGNPDGPG